MPRPRVVIGDSSQAMLAFLEILLEPQFEVVASVADAETLVVTAKNLAPDLVVLDFSLSFLEGLSVGRQLLETAPATKVVFYSSHEDPAYAAAAFEVGAKGYLVKHRTVDLGHYLGRVLRGERVSCPDNIQKKAR
ncbi:MAG: putative Response regulator [Nitrospira sp.]|jgi:DNA-binding NarL/FixJ family response regulator|nr:putative Response regulator [Nitrospira sp.]